MFLPSLRFSSASSITKVYTNTPNWRLSSIRTIRTVRRFPLGIRPIRAFSRFRRTSSLQCFTFQSGVRTRLKPYTSCVSLPSPSYRQHVCHVQPTLCATHCTGSDGAPFGQIDEALSEYPEKGGFWAVLRMHVKLASPDGPVATSMVCHA